VEALQGVELTGTNRSCGLATITFFCNEFHCKGAYSVYQVETFVHLNEPLDCGTPDKRFSLERFIARDWLEAVKKPAED
jgi:hypothetical protein